MQDMMCLVVITILILVVLYFVCVHESESATSKRTSGRIASVDPKPDCAPASEQHGAANASVAYKTEHFFSDSGEDMESYNKTDMQRAKKASNMRADTGAKSDTGTDTSPPGRLLGFTNNSWLSLLNCESKPRVHGTAEIAFGGSSHLETLRSKVG